MDADLYLTGKCALGDLAIEGRAREAGAGKDGRQAQDAVGGIHGDDFPFGDGQWLPWAELWRCFPLTQVPLWGREAPVAATAAKTGGRRRMDKNAQASVRTVGLANNLQYRGNGFSYRATCWLLPKLPVALK